MAASKKIFLVTGANSGIGYELVRQLIADKTRHVLLGSRSSEKGEKAVKELQTLYQPGSVELLQVDVSSFDSVTKAAEKVTKDHGKLDGLINNAGVAMPPGNLPVHEQMDICFRTNVTGTQMMSDAFAPLLEKAEGTARIVNISSGAGSIANRLDPSSGLYKQMAPQYRGSKAALNMITAEQSVQYGEKGMKVFAYCPGFCVSSLSHFNTAENGAKPTSEGVSPIVDILEGKRDSEHGGFLHGEGQYPW